MIHAYAFNLAHQPVFTAFSNLEPPVLTYHPVRKKWRLENNYSYAGQGFSITIPAGYEFDLASVPRPVWWAIAPFELSIVAPLIHDFLYDYGGALPTPAVQPYRTFTRRETDNLFLEIMRREGIPDWRCRVAYNAVRAFGSFAWKGRVVPAEERGLQFLPV